MLMKLVLQIKSTKKVLKLTDLGRRSLIAKPLLVNLYKNFAVEVPGKFVNLGVNGERAIVEQGAIGCNCRDHLRHDRSNE